MHQTHATKADGVWSVHEPVQQSGQGDVLPPNWSSPLFLLHTWSSPR